MSTRRHLAAGADASEQFGTRGLVSYGRSRCRESTTCAHDLGHWQPPDDRQGNSSAPGYVPRLRVVRNSRAGRKGEGGKKFQLRDHAPAQPLGSEQLGTQTGLAGGVLSVPGHRGLWLRHSGDAWPAAAPPASGEPVADIPASDNSADSSTAARTCAYTPCGGRSSTAVGVLWPNSRAFPYSGERPREVPSPKGKLGEDALTSSPSATKT